MEPAERDQREPVGHDGAMPGAEQAAQAGVARLVVAGIGGAGCNAINRMIEAGVRGVEFLALNTDAQALDLSRAPRRLRLGEALTRGLGAGGNPELGRRAAEESDAAIRTALDGTDMVFVTAGMGGGTGTGASPLVAQAARELGALVIAVVTTPFAFERRRKIVAQHGLAALREVVDALIVVPNERLMELAERDLGLFEAYRRADDVLRQGVQGISDLVTIPGLINLDFADVRAVMADAGSALIATGGADGEDRAMVAARQALTNPLLDVDIAGARGVIFNVTGGEDLTLREVEAIAALITEAAHPDANIIYGTVYDPAAVGTLAVSVVATGFEPRVRHERGAGQLAASQPHHYERPLRSVAPAAPVAPVVPPDAAHRGSFPVPPRDEPEDDLDPASGFSITPIEPYVMPAQSAPQRSLGGRLAPDEDDARTPREQPIQQAPTAAGARSRVPGYHGDEFVAGDESEPQETSQSHGPHRRWEIFGRRS
ncbi:MAG TPA: cell division protein FtsZ [Ktedonobacterales bacterium]